MEARTITVNNFRSICRCCLSDCKNNSSFNIYSFLILKNVIGDVLSKCTSIQVNRNDTLPKQLCQQCFRDLTNCYKFADKCQKSEQILLSILNHKETATKTEEGETEPKLKQEEINVTDLEETSSDIPDAPSQKQSQFVNIKSNSLDKVSNEKLHMCEHCGKTFQRLSTLRFHFCIRRKNQGDFTMGTGQQKGLRYKCSFCEKEFMNKAKWVRHERMHTGERPFKCGFCEKRFTTNPYKLAHERIHTGEKPHKCRFCEKRFTQKDQQLFHETAHTGDHPRFMCDFCKKGFASKKDKVTHERIHTGEKPYKCRFCEKSFTQKVLQDAHEKTWHTRENMLKCDFCEKSFAMRKDKLVHERIHTGEKPYKCDFCEKSFARKQCVMFHQRTHMGEKPYKCHFCEKSFIRQQSLNVHERIHINKRPYACDECHTSFPQKVHLKRHILKHRQEEEPS